jgi:kelch-like protein 24/35
MPEQNMASKYVETAASNIRNTSEFLELEGKELASIIQEDNLQIESEDRLCDTVFQWLENDLEKRQKFCGNLFEHIRLSFLNPEYLLTIEDSQLPNLKTIF